MECQKIHICSFFTLNQSINQCIEHSLEISVLDDVELCENSFSMSFNGSFLDEERSGSSFGDEGVKEGCFNLFFVHLLLTYILLVFVFLLWIIPFFSSFSCCWFRSSSWTILLIHGLILLFYTFEFVNLWIFMVLYSINE